MRSRASIGNHPIHPALVAIPIGAFFLALIADLGFLRGDRPFWAEMAFIAILVGIVAALAAAVAGMIDYVDLPADSRLRATATTHMVLNLTVVVLYAISLYLRWMAAPVPFIPSIAACSVAFIAFTLLAVSGWLGGKMVFEMHAGVFEPSKA